MTQAAPWMKRASGVRTAVWLLLMLALAFAHAQPRVEVRLGVAGTPVAEAWNPLQVVVRDAPGATLRWTVDAGGLDLGEVPQVLEALVAPAGGVQRLDLDVPLPSWRRITWRVEQDGRVLASGGLGARDRDERRLTLLLSARPAAWADRLADVPRWIVVTAADLPERPAGWDGVATLIVDGTAAPPTAETIVTAAASGVRVLLPQDAPAGYGDVGRLVGSGARAVGAGRIEPLTTEGARVAAAEAADLRSRAQLALVASADAPVWRHLAPWTVGTLALAYAILTFLLARTRGPAPLISLVLLWVASLAASPLAAPPEPRPTSEDALVIVSGGVGLRYEHWALASLPTGETPLDGVLAPIEARPVTWRDGRTHVSLDAGGRAAFVASPRLVVPPDDVRSAVPGAPSGTPEALAELVRVGGALIRSGDAWWWVLDPEDRS